MKWFFFRIGEQRVRLDLHPLEAYEADGGRYDDRGNGGESLADLDDLFAGLVYHAARDQYELTEQADAAWAQDERVQIDPAGRRLIEAEVVADLVLERNRAAGRAQFIAAATVPYHETGLPDSDVLEAAGLDRRDYWHDSVTDYFLLRAWPEAAPLEARFLD